MEQKIKSRQRRRFIKGVGAGIAVAALTAPNMAFAARKLPTYARMDFEFVIEDPIPLIPRERVYDYFRSGIKLYKNAEAQKNDDGLMLNSMAGFIAQLCDGTRSLETILTSTAKKFEIDVEGLRPRVVSFIRQLFDDGYLVFASTNTVPQDKRIHGITLLDRNDKSLKIASKNRESVY